MDNATLSMYASRVWDGTKWCYPYLEKLLQEKATLEAELLRVRTTGHGAAHELDNIAVECGLGHSPKPGDVAAHVRQLREAVRVWKEKHKVLLAEVEAWMEWQTIANSCCVCSASLVIEHTPHCDTCQTDDEHEFNFRMCARTALLLIEQARAATDAAKAREG